jgi:hypothetical protein
MLKATLIGGALFGVVGGIPVLNLINCACCALIVGGGFLAAYLYSRECKAGGIEFRPGNGALVGLVAGLFYAIATTLVGAIFKAIMPQADPEEMAEMMEQFGAPPESVDMALQFMEGSSGVMGLIIGFFITLLVAAVFSTIGGLIGGASFKVEPPAPTPPSTQAPPPAQTPPTPPAPPTE